MLKLYASILIYTVVCGGNALGMALEPIHVDQIEKLELTTVAALNPAEPKAGICRLSGKQAKKFFESLGVGKPIRPGAPAAMVTGTLKFVQSGQHKSFRVYNERLLNDAENRDVYFELKKPLTLKACLTRQ